MNEWEWESRKRKARAITHHLRELMDRNPAITLEAIGQADQVARQLAAQVAGVNPPSDETWLVVCAMLAGVPLENPPGR